MRSANKGITVGLVAAIDDACVEYLAADSETKSLSVPHGQEPRDVQEGSQGQEEIE
jgi:hypothetical protein